MFKTHFVHSHPECEAAMRVAGHQSQRLLLRALPGECREPAFDEAAGRVAFAASGVWASPTDGGVAAGGLAGEREARGTIDAGDGSGGHLSQAGNQPTPAGARNLPVFIEAQGHHGTRPGLVRGHHLHPHAAGVHVSDGGDGLVEPVCAGLGVEQHAGGRLLCAGMEPGLGVRSPAAIDLQHRSGSAVHLLRVCRGGAGSGSAGEHGWTRALDGQPVRRAALAQFQI